VPRHEGGRSNNEPRLGREQAAQDEPHVDRNNRQLEPEDARHRLNDIRAGKEQSYIGPECFGPAIRHVVVPRDMTSVSKSCPRYNGGDKPNSWLSDYAMAVQIAGGDGLVAARFLPLMLEGTARSWIETLPEKSIHNWRDMERVFTQHFQGTYNRPKTYTDLTRCVQGRDESATAFLARWIQTKASCENVDDNQAIHAFTTGLLKGSSLRHKLVRMQCKNLGVMLEVASTYAQADDDARDPDGIHDLAPGRRAGNKRKAPQDDKANTSGEVAVAFKGKGNNQKWKGKGSDAGPSKQRLTYDQVKSMPCPIHAGQGKVNHTLAECRFMDDVKKDPEVGWKPKKMKKAEKARKDDDEDAMSVSEDEQPKPPRKEKKYPKVHGQLVCFLGTPSAKEEKAELRELNATMPAVPQYLNWSEMPITWDRDDHPDRVPSPGKYALVVDPVVDNYRLTKVLMDGGSSLNILYEDTLKRMNLADIQLDQSKVKFHGIVPGKQAKSMGSIKLEVTFGTEENYRTEFLRFEVVPFKSAYHCIFGRPAFAKFMARPCYVYSKLKLPGPNGTITVNGNFEKAKQCERGNAAFAEAVLHAEELEMLKKEIDASQLPDPLKTAESKTSFKASEETKTMDLVPGDSTKQLTIGSALDSA